MKLTKFRIKNYKSIADSGDCELYNDNIIILAGQNESGKSNILEALSKFEIDEKITSEALPDGIDDVTPEVICTFSIDINEINDITDFEKIPNALKYMLLDEKTITIHKTYPGNEYSFDEKVIKNLKDIVYTDNNDDDKQLYENSNNTNIPESEEVENKPQEEKVKEQPPKKAREDVKNGHKALAKTIVRYTPYFVYYESFNDRLPRKIYLNQINNEQTVGYKAVNDFIDLADIDVKHLQGERDVKSIDNYLEKKSATVTGNFLNYWTQKVDGESKVRIITERNHDENGYFLSFFVKDDSSKKYPEQRSKGFLWFLSFYLRLNAEKRNKKDNGTIILIDEPGSYLHSKAQKDVLRILEDEMTTSGSQVIFSTHSSDLIDPDKLNRIRLVVNRKGKGTKIISKFHRNYEDQDFYDALSPIVRAIGKDLGTGFDLVGRKNILLEGISDYYYLTALRNHPKLSISKDIKLIPMTGVLKIRHMASLMIGWGLDFAVVMDNDGNTESEYETLTKKLNIDQKQIYRIQKAKMIENLFSEHDFRTFVKPEVGRDENISVENGEKVLLSHRFYNAFSAGDVNLDETTITNFKKIFSFIDDNFK